MSPHQPLINQLYRKEILHALLARLHAAGLGVLTDFVPNHVARSYRLTVMPGTPSSRTMAARVFSILRTASFGSSAIRRAEVRRIRLPPHGAPFSGELEYGRVTGNNVPNWQPSQHDWYKTVKLNYGFDLPSRSCEFSV